MAWTWGSLLLAFISLLPLNVLAGAPQWTVYWCDNYLRRGCLLLNGIVLLLTVC